MKRLYAFYAIVVAICAAASSPAAFAVSTGDFLAETGIGALCGLGVTSAGLALLSLVNETTSGNDDNVALMVAGAAVVVAAWPAATATGVYLTGEAVDGPSANKGAAWGWPTLAAYGESALFGGVVLILEATRGNVRDDDLNDIYFGIFLVDVVSKPFLVTYVYNRVKKPASPPESRLAVEPYVSLAAGGDGGAVPLYGVTLSF